MSYAMLLSHPISKQPLCIQNQKKRVEARHHSKKTGGKIIKKKQKTKNKELIHLLAIPEPSNRTVSIHA